jgi:hypothetical protein
MNCFTYLINKTKQHKINILYIPFDKQKEKFTRFRVCGRQLWTPVQRDLRTLRQQRHMQQQ